MNSIPGEAFYRDVLNILKASGIPFLVGGAYALRAYTGIERDTKDLDVFVKPSDCAGVLRLFSEHHYKTELHFTHWIGKIYSGEYMVDVIFNSGNGLCPVDEEWFLNASDGESLGLPVKLCPPEEIIWQKAFVMERHRYDGADIAHILHECAGKIDWDRLLRRFGQHWRVLLSHLILYGFIYPCDRSRISPKIMAEMISKLTFELTEKAPDDKVCQGTFLSLMQYLRDIREGSYADARLSPRGPMSQEEIDRFTQSIVKEESAGSNN